MNSETLATPQSKTRHYLFVFSQGFKSCSAGIADGVPRLKTIVSDAMRDAPDLKIHSTFIESCFTGDVSHAFGAKEQFFYKIERWNGRKIAQKEANPETFAKTIAEVVDHEMPAEGQARVVMIGHSHGGWAVMNAAKYWSSKAELRSLITIDPISYKNCTLTDVILESSVTVRSFSDECLRAPSDLAADAGIIRSHITNFWHNHFQTKYYLIHSGAIAGASSNRDLAFPNDFFAHTAILSDKRVWENIKTTIATDILSQ